MGRLSDRFGVMRAGDRRHARCSAPATSPPRCAPALGAYTSAQGLLIGVGSAATFSPLLAHVSLWFDAAARHRRRDLRQRQLPRRRRVAADRPAFHRQRRLAPHVSRHRRVLHRDDGAARAAAARAGRRAAIGAMAATAHRHRAARRRAPLGHFAATRCRCCWSSPASAAASRCRCRRCISSRIAATWATVPRAARRCCR